MSSIGDRYDAVAESFFAMLERDPLRQHSFATRQEAGTAVFDFIDALYTPVRPTRRSITWRRSRS